MFNNNISVETAMKIQPVSCTIFLICGLKTFQDMITSSLACNMSID